MFCITLISDKWSGLNLSCEGWRSISTTTSIGRHLRKTRVLFMTLCGGMIARHQVRSEVMGCHPARGREGGVPSMALQSCAVQSREVLEERRQEKALEGGLE